MQKPEIIREKKLFNIEFTLSYWDSAMFMAKIMRILRSRITLSVISGLGILYIFSILLWNFQSDDIIESESGTIRRPQEFKWGSDESTNASKTVTTCRNSVQGKVLLADDQGYVCHRVDQLGTGCCNTAVETTQKYACDTCNKHGCCAIYEYCVSCCLHPDKKLLLKKVLGQVGENSPLYASVSDHFELCLVRCRTSSQSVQHETLYRDPKAKHCYGEGPPPIVNSEA